MMTVDEFMDLSIDSSWQKVKIYDVDLGEEVFEGTIDDMPDKYRFGEVGSFDIIDDNSPTLTLNVEANTDFMGED